MREAVLIGLAGFVGTVLRYWVSDWFAKRYGDSFPWGTLVLNLAGCLLIGVLFQLLHDRLLIGVRWRAALIVGFLGALTTFSAYGLQTFGLLREGRFFAALVYMALSNLLGVVLVWTGYRLARLW